MCFHNLWPLSLTPVSTHYRRGLYEDEQVSWCWVLVQGVSPGQTRPHTSTPHLRQASGYDGKINHLTEDILRVLFFIFSAFFSFFWSEAFHRNPNVKIPMKVFVSFFLWFFPAPVSSHFQPIHTESRFSMVTLLYRKKNSGPFQLTSSKTQYKHSEIVEWVFVLNWAAVTNV